MQSSVILWIHFFCWVSYPQCCLIYFIIVLILSSVIMFCCSDIIGVIFSFVLVTISSFNFCFKSFIFSPLSLSLSIYIYIYIYIYISFTIWGGVFIYHMFYKILTVENLSLPETLFTLNLYSVFLFVFLDLNFHTREF